MASIEFIAPSEAFPGGQAVAVYPESNWATSLTGLPPRGAPPGSSVTSGTLSSTRRVTFSGLDDGAPYFVAGQVGSEWRYVGFETPPVASSSVGGSSGAEAFDGAASIFSRASLAGDTDVRGSLGVLNDDLYMATSNGVSAAFHGVRRLARGASDWQTLTTFAAPPPSVAIGSGLSGGVVFMGKLYFPGWGAPPGSIFRLDLNGDASFSAFTTMDIDAGFEDAHPHHVLWGNLWINTYANAAAFASSGVGAGVWRWDGVSGSAVQVVNASRCGADAFAVGKAFYRGRLWISIDGNVGEVWSVGPDFVPRCEYIGPSVDIAEWNGELIAVRKGTWSALYVWRDRDFVPISALSPSLTAQGPLVSVGNRLFLFDSYGPPHEFRRDGSFTTLTVPANTAALPSSVKVWDGALWWLTSLGEQCVFKLPLGQDAFNRQLANDQIHSGGAGVITDTQLPALERDLVLTSAAAGFVQKGTDGRYRRLSLASGAAVVAALNYSAPNPDHPNAPVCTAQPTVSGTTVVGSTLTCTPGTWTGNDITGVASTDLLTSANHGFIVGQRVTFYSLTGGAGLVAGTIYYVIASGLTTSTFKVSAAAGGAALNFTTDLTAGKVGTLTYQWYRDGSPIYAATANTRLLAVGDAPHTLHCVVTATSGGGFAQADSNASAVTAAAPPVDPSVTLGGKLFAHHRAEDEAGADGAVLAQATDLSVNARHLTQATAGKRALKKTAIVNGKAVYRFDGVDDRYGRDYGLIAQTIEMYAVCKFRSSAGPADQQVMGDFSGGRAQITWKPGQLLTADAGAVGCQFAAALDDRFHFVKVKFAGAASSISVDGVVLITINAGTGGLQYMSIGGDAIDQLFADIDIAEIIIATGGVTGGEDAALVYYAQSTYATP